MPQMSDLANPVRNRPDCFLANPEIDTDHRERCVPTTRRMNSGQVLFFSAHLKRSLPTGYETTLSLHPVLALQMPFGHLGS